MVTKNFKNENRKKSFEKISLNFRQLILETQFLTTYFLINIPLKIFVLLGDAGFRTSLSRVGDMISLCRPFSPHNAVRRFLPSSSGFEVVGKLSKSTSS